ncbi:MAG: DnaD domain protein [Clostridia bacterium]|nr:DnaD domain protein [Clostridia bacterium]
MIFHVNPSLSWGAVFTVPAVIADKYIKLASPEQLKVLLWVLRHASEQPTVEAIAAETGISHEDISEILSFWIYEGILVSEDVKIVKAAEQVNTFIPEKTVPPKKDLPSLPEIKPTQAQIIARTKEANEINELFKEAQKKFGRTLGYDGQCTLLMMHDQYGLPVEVILMLIEYCVSIHKTSNSFIAAVAKNWAEEEIDTLEKAVEKVEYLQQCRSLWNKFRQATGLTAPNPTSSQAEFLRSWKYDLGFDIDMILLAYEEMADRCTRLSFPYINKVLTAWKSKGYTTPEQVFEDKKQFSRNKKKQNEDSVPASYDINEIENRLMHGPIVYKKKDE